MRWLLQILGSLLLAATDFSAALAQPAVLVRVANGTTPELLSLPDDRAFSVLLPKELPGSGARIIHVPGAVRAIQALVADEVDVAIATLPAGLAAIESGQDLVAFSLASGARPYLHMVAHQSIRSWHELEDQDVAVIGPVDSTHYLAQMHMRVAGARPERAVWRSVGGGAGRANALLAGAAKATMLQSAQALDLLARGPFHVLAPPAGARHDFIFKVFWARRSYLRSNARVAEAIVRAQLRSVRQALDKTSFVDQAVDELRPLPRDLIARSYDMVREMGVWDPDNGLLSRAAGDATVAELVRMKVLRNPIEFDRWATTEHARKALASLGAHH